MLSVQLLILHDATTKEAIEPLSVISMAEVLKKAPGAGILLGLWYGIKLNYCWLFLPLQLQLNAAFLV